METIILPQASSTNSEMASRLQSLPHGTIIRAIEQTAGRGQRGNSWEAEPGANLTMSLLLRDLPFSPAAQFVISEIAALAVAHAVASRLPSSVASSVAVKWPNDIYVGNKKIAGILIECGITGQSISHAIIGIGLNINQLSFLSPAPNPVSLRQLIPSLPILDIDPIAKEIRQDILREIVPDIDAASIHHRYLALLWRRQGFHTWRISKTGEIINAAISGVSPEGFISLLPQGSTSPLAPLAFKEVEAILPSLP
ncbi:MAG: biotin--[acetyl-CoA-carboxylase] ligase [Pseudoflavonifractor sp.]|nr:biotin--[acetyl-CoA-carboxylase] ligase [Alloprevotella sp.]MCM1116715.1 biotin--[acetyl-CoA-carboxylase] ligase [Pseudoflavonifractor sp.]